MAYRAKAFLDGNGGIVRRVVFMRHGYWTFPAIAWRNPLLCRLAIFVGERFNGGKYCFRVD